MEEIYGPDPVQVPAAELWTSERRPCGYWRWALVDLGYSLRDGPGWKDASNGRASVEVAGCLQQPLRPPRPQL